jgi:hypothetical protein
LSSIGNYAFSECSSLTSINLPANVTHIGYYAFVGCSSLPAIEVNSANKDYSSRDGVLFNKALTELVAYPAGKKVSTYAVPATVTSIGGGAFEECGSLVSVSFPAILTSIGYAAFDKCINLRSISLPEGLNRIGGLAFQRCSSLSSVSVLAQRPPALGSDVFPRNTRITVPAASFSAYKSASGWKDYSAQLEELR